MIEQSKQSEQGTIKFENKKKISRNQKIYNSLLDFLSKLYPHCFTKDCKNIKPLQVGIFVALKRDLRKKNLNVAYKSIVKYGFNFLERYTNNVNYLFSMLNSSERVCLDPKQHQFISDEHKAFARQRLTQIASDLANKDFKKHRSLILFINNKLARFNFNQKTNYKSRNYKKMNKIINQGTAVT